MRQKLILLITKIYIVPSEKPVMLEKYWMSKNKRLGRVWSLENTSFVNILGLKNAAWSFVVLMLRGLDYIHDYMYMIWFKQQITDHNEGG